MQVLYHGSMRISRFIAERCALARPPKTVNFSLSRTVPALVTTSADLDLAAALIVKSVFGRTASPTVMVGECLVIDRVYVQQDALQEFLDMLLPR
jgi:acyl-CoA reductase-like NAD-dependent aldehyde dehydrogenase